MSCNSSRRAAEKKSIATQPKLDGYTSALALSSAHAAWRHVPAVLSDVVGGAAATGRAAATGGSRASAATGARRDAGADVGFDFHFGFLSCLRVIAQYPAGPRGRPNPLAYLVGVDGAAAATGRTAATSAAAATVIGAAATIGAKAAANIGLDLHFSFLFMFCAIAQYPSALGPSESFTYAQTM
jgi:hypothetical protein